MEKEIEERSLLIFNGGVSDEQIASWKKEHRKVHAIEVADGDELYIGYFKRPSMETISAVNHLSKTDEMKGSKTLFENCWLGGDTMLKTDALIHLAAMKQLGKMFESVIGNIKNL